MNIEIPLDLDTHDGAYILSQKKKRASDVLWQHVCKLKSDGRTNTKIAVILVTQDALLIKYDLLQVSPSRSSQKISGAHLYLPVKNSWHAQLKVLKE